MIKAIWLFCVKFTQMNLHVQRKIVIALNNEAIGGDVVKKLNDLPE